MIDHYILYKNIPTLDLHGHDRYSAVIYADEFIKDNVKLKNRLVKIIHGKGSGVLKNEVHKFLKKNKLVKDYRLDLYNIGTTIVELNL